jgi:hypothetical protein
MIKALAPRMRQGCSWVWLSIVLAGGFPAAVQAQDPPKAKSETPATKPAATSKTKDASKAGDASKAAEKKPPADAKAADDEPETPEVKTHGVEVFKDPRAEEAIKVFKTISGYRDVTPGIISQVKSMAAGGAVDRDAIQRFVQGMAYRLVDKGNLNALISPPVGRPPSKALQDASDNLLDVLNTAKLAKNTSFLSTYNQELIATLSKLLDNNLFSRIEAMIVLGQTGSPAALPIFLKELKDAKQTVWVKLWALRGLSSIVENGARVDAAISAQEAITAGKAISEFLEGTEDLPWPAKLRAFEALGAMRQPSGQQNMQKVEMAATAMKTLVDPEARPEVRAAAAWALGMMRVNPSVARYNLSLIAYNIGKLAATIGEDINASFSSNRTRSEYLTGLLVTPIYQAFFGLEGARESGLLKTPGGSASQAAVKPIADLSSTVARAAVELIRAPNGQIKNRQKDLGDRVAALKTYLDKNAPKDFHLVPGADGPEYRLKNAEVAEEPAEKPKVAGARGVR